MVHKTLKAGKVRLEGLMPEDAKATARDASDTKAVKKLEKKGRKPSFPSFTALRWLYLCALDGRELSATVKNANDYLIALYRSVGRP